MMTDDDKPPISLAAERKQRERDFATERADLLQELRDIGIEEPEAMVQNIMLTEWAVFHAARLLEYHSIDGSPEAIIELVKLMTKAETILMK